MYSLSSMHTYPSHPHPLHPAHQQSWAPLPPYLFFLIFPFFQMVPTRPLLPSSSPPFHIFPISPPPQSIPTQYLLVCGLSSMNHWSSCHEWTRMQHVMVQLQVLLHSVTVIPMSPQHCGWWTHCFYAHLSDDWATRYCIGPLEEKSPSPHPRSTKLVSISSSRDFVW